MLLLTNLSRPKTESGIILRDFSFIAGDDRVFKVGSPPVGASTLAQSSSSSGSRKAAWMRHLSSWTELVQPFPTHYDSKGNTVSRLDRAFIACPISLVLELYTGCPVVGTPEETCANGISDHAPLALRFGVFRPPWLGSAHPSLGLQTSQFKISS